jgi:hypothetical protein
VQQLGGDPGGDDDARGDRQVGRAAADGAEADDVLHVEGEEEEHRHERGERDHLDGVGGGQPLDPEDGEREQRVAAAQLGDGEGGEHDSGRGELTDGAGAPPALVGGPDQGVDQQQHAAGGQRRAGDVEARGPRRGPAAGHQTKGAEQDQRADGQVDEQHPAPSRALGQHTAEEHPGRRGQAGDRAPDAERLVAVVAGVEAGGQDRQPGRGHQRRAGPLRQPGAD